MYKIIGIDQREYGPVSAAEVRQWVRENRANAMTGARPEGATEWRPLSAFPEFADLFAVPQIPPPYYQKPPPAYYPSQLGNGMATTGLIFSLVGLVCCCFPIFPFFGLIFSSIGLVLAIKNPLRSGKAASIIGIVLAVLEILLWLVMFGLSLASDSPSMSFHYSI